MVVSDVKRSCILGAVDLRPCEIADGEEVGPQSATSDLSKAHVTDVKWCRIT